jgi:hypothetical protein
MAAALPAADPKSPFELLNNLETIFNGAFLQQEEEDGDDIDNDPEYREKDPEYNGMVIQRKKAPDENFIKVKVKSKAGSRPPSICFRKDVLNLPIIKTALGQRPGPGRPRLKPLINGHVPYNNSVKKPTRIFSNWLECHRCEYKCRKRRPLQNHMLEEHNEIIYLCDHCENIYKDKDELMTHKSSVHGGVKYPCPDSNCSFSSSSVSELEEHVKLHEPSEYQCEFCHIKCESIQKLNIHMEHEHQGIRFYCEDCNFSHSSREVLNCHNQQVHNGRPSRCSKCEFATINLKLLQAHEATFHRAVEYKCNKCDFRCNWESNLKQHYEKFHGQREWQCEYCDFTCKWKAGFNKHMSDKHPEAAQLLTQCTFCGLQFACKRDLKRHIKENHEKTMEFNCSYCGKNFPKKPNLKIHERIHTGEKPYKCELCGHAFTAASNLYHHKKKHMKEASNPKPIKMEKPSMPGESSSHSSGYDSGYLPQPSGSSESNYRQEPPENHGHPLVENHGGHMVDSHRQEGSHMMEGPVTKTEPGYPGDQQYLSNFPQYYGGGYQHQKGGQGNMYESYNSSPAHSLEAQGGGDQHFRRQSSGENHTQSNSGDYRRLFSEEQYHRMIAQEEEFRKRSFEEQYRKFSGPGPSMEEQYRKFSSSGSSIEEQYRKFASEEHYRKLAAEEQYRMLAAASKIDRGGLWMPALH